MSEAPILRATHQADVRLGDLAMPCYVLGDGSRVLSGRAFLGAFDIRGHGNAIAHRMAKIFNEHIATPLYYRDLSSRIEAPIAFRDLNNRQVVGYEAELLIDLCKAFLRARRHKAIRTQVGHRYAMMAEVMISAAAKVGIVALVDEATGYQSVRDREALQRLLGQYIRSDLAEWVKTFPDEFYEQISRLKGWPNLVTGKRPGVVGHITNTVVYARLAPGIIREMQKRNPRLPDGGRSHKHHQHLTDETGYPELRSLLTGVVALMRASQGWGVFERLLDRSYPKFNDTLPLLLEGKDGEPM